jgi:hypothetical protein
LLGDENGEGGMLDTTGWGEEGVTTADRSFRVRFAKAVPKIASIFELTIVSMSATVTPLSFLLGDGNGKGGTLNTADWGVGVVMLAARSFRVGFAKAALRIASIFELTRVSTSAMVRPLSQSLSVAGGGLGLPPSGKEGVADAVWASGRVQRGGTGGGCVGLYLGFSRTMLSVRVESVNM